MHGTPEDIALGPDGNLWFTEYQGFAIGRLTTSGTLTEFNLGQQGYGYPDDIVAGPDGNLWFTYYQDPTTRRSLASRTWARSSLPGQSLTTS